MTTQRSCHALLQLNRGKIVFEKNVPVKYGDKCKPGICVLSEWACHFHIPILFLTILARVGETSSEIILEIYRNLKCCMIIWIH